MRFQYYGDSGWHIQLSFCDANAAYFGSVVILISVPKRQTGKNFKYGKPGNAYLLFSLELLIQMALVSVVPLADLFNLRMESGDRDLM